MTEICLTIYRFFRSHRAFFWSLMVALFAFFGFFAAQIHLEEDIAKLLPSSKNEDGTTKLAFADLKIKDKTFLLFEALEPLDGDRMATADSLITVCDSFVAELQADMDSMCVKGDTLLENIFSQISFEDLMYDGIDYMMNNLPAYIDTSVYSSLDTMFTREHFEAQMQRNYEAMLSPVGSMFPELIQMDPMGVRTVLLDNMQGMMQGMGGTYKIIDGHFFTPDTSVCIVFLTPHFTATNTGGGAKLFSLLNEKIARYETETDAVKVCYHGSPARGAYNSWQIKSDLKSTIIGSLVIVLLFIFLCFRNWNTIPLLLLPVAFGTLFGLAMMYFIKGQFSLLALGIGAIVLGVALSYVLHVITHYKYVSDPEQVLRDQVTPVFLGCLTTIGSFMGLIFINTELLQDFGLFATFAVVGTTVFSLLFLPQFFNPEKNKRNRRAFAIIDKINVYPFDRRLWLQAIIGIVVAVSIAFYIVDGTSFDDDMRNLGYLSDNVTYSETMYQQKTRSGYKQQYFAASGDTMEEALEHFSSMAAKLDSLGEAGLVKSYTRTDELFVPETTQQQRIDAWHNYWTPERLQTVRTLIQQTAPKAGIRPEAFDQFFEVATADYEPSHLYEAGIIPAGFQSTLMEQSRNGDYLCFTSVICEMDTLRSDSTDYHRICDVIAPQPHMMVLDTYYYTTDTLRQLNADFNFLQWVSMAFVFVVLLLSFRFNIKHTLLGFLPILLSWLIVLGVMCIFGVKFNLINIIISTFIFGIGVDYSIFVMNGLLAGKDGAEELGDGEKPRDVLLLSYHKTAILFSAVVLIVTVASMLFAEHPAIKSVGFATLIGMVSAVLLSYVTQPFLFRMLNRVKGKE
ncbi:MAG: MMPL family transporter [Bacteroidales bacterium]|nr:MMPL family transporter [Candidatus Liminaster caballi]